MIQYICDICKDVIQDADSITKIEVAYIKDNIPIQKEYHCCDDCKSKINDFIDNLIKTTADKKETPELDDAKRPKFYDFTQDYKNMVLRDFLSSNFYLQSKHTFIFRTTDNRIISDFKPWMSKNVLSVNPPTESHKEIIVTLK